MARSSPKQSIFSGGELSPTAFGRDDLDKYRTSVALMRNYVPMLEGPAQRRSGTRHVDALKDETAKGRIVPFVFSTTQAYILLFENNNIRIYFDEGRLDDPPGTPVEVATTYTTAELFELQFAQSADTLYIVHPSHAPAKLTRTSPTTWTLTDITFFDGPFNEVNTTATTVTPTSASGAVTLNASAAIFQVGRDEGRHFRFKKIDGAGQDGWGNVIIDTVNSTTQATGTWQRILGNPPAAETDWRFGAWYTGNYPAAISFNQQRLVFVADPDHPQTIYGSVNGDFEAFSPSGSVLRNEEIWEDDGGLGDDITDDNGYQYAIAANEVNVIRWINTARSMIIGTTGGIWSAQASQELEAITPLNIAVRRDAIDGVMNLQPVNVESSIFYVGSSRRRAFVVGFNLQNDAYDPEDVSLLARHLLQTSPVMDIAYAADPHSTGWLVREDGVLVGFTAELKQQVAGWHQHVLGGSFSGGDAVVESVAVIPATEGAVTTGAADNIEHDQVWLIVKRTINGVTRRYLEFMEDEWREDLALEDAFFVDSGLTYSGGSTVDINGLDHLLGETVDILGDGEKQPSKVVVDKGGGNIGVTLDTAVTKAQVGLGYSSRLRTLPLVPPDPAGSSRGKPARVDHLTLGFNRSIGGRISTNPDMTEFDPLLLADQAVPITSPPSLFTGPKTLPVQVGWEADPQVEIRQEDPYPHQILYMVPRVRASERGG